MGASDDQVKAAPSPEEPFERAKLPMVIAAIGVAGGLAIAGSVERTAGGAIVLAAWVLGIGAMHRLGRAGSVRRPATPATSANLATPPERAEPAQPETPPDSEP